MSSGKLEKVKEMKRYSIEISGLSETQWERQK